MLLVYKSDLHLATITFRILENRSFKVSVDRSTCDPFIIILSTKIKFFRTDGGRTDEHLVFLCPRTEKALRAIPAYDIVVKRILNECDSRSVYMYNYSSSINYTVEQY